MKRGIRLAVALPILASTPVWAGSGPAVDSLPAAAAVDPSDVEWSPERYLAARPMEPPWSRSAVRELTVESPTSLAAERSTGAPARPPTRRASPRFDRYIHEPGARPARLRSRHKVQDRAIAAALLAAGGPWQNRGTAGLRFSSSRLVPRDARVVYPYSTVGKLFFDKPNSSGSFTCSASVIQRRLVLTAGHCVHTPGEGWHSNFSFVPAYFEGNAPFGTWRVERIWTTGEWFNGDGVPNVADFGILVMRDDFLGQAIGEVTGWLGWKTNQLAPNHVHMLGYPGNLDDGTEMHQVASGAFDCCVAGTAIYGSDMGPGSSGGPWIQNFGVRARRQNVGQNTQQNRVVGVGSYGSKDKRSLLNGSSILKGPFANLANEACADGNGNCQQRPLPRPPG